MVSLFLYLFSFLYLSRLLEPNLEPRCFVVSGSAATLAAVKVYTVEVVVLMGYHCAATFAVLTASFDILCYVL